MLLIRFCEVLRQQSVDHYVVEDKNTFLAKELEKAGTTVIAPSDPVPSADFLFVPYSGMLREALQWASDIPNAKVLTWIISPNEIFSSNFPLMGTALKYFGYPGAYVWSQLLKFHRKEFEVLLLRLCKGQGIILMDGATKRVVDYMFGSSYSGYMPIIPIPAPINPEVIEYKNKGAGLRVGYLGRLDDYKFSALQKFIAITLSQHAKKEPITLHIVGTGPRISDLRAACGVAGITLVEHGFQANDNARKILINNCDLGASMGTAALDLAGSGLPTIIIDPSIRLDALVQDKFRFVHEIEGCTLGEFRDFPAYKVGKSNFSAVIDIIKNNYEISRKGIEYVANNHKPASSFNRLLACIQNSTVSVFDVRKSAVNISNTIRRFKQFY